MSKKEVGHLKIKEDDDDDEDSSEDEIHLQKQYQFHRICKSCTWTIVSVLSIGVIISGIWWGAYDVGRMLPTVCIEAESGENVGLCELIGSRYDVYNQSNNGTIYMWYNFWKVVETCNGLLEKCENNQTFRFYDRVNITQETKYKVGNCYACYSDANCTTIYFKDEPT